MRTTGKTYPKYEKQPQGEGQNGLGVLCLNSNS